MALTSKAKSIDHGYAWVVLASCTCIRTLVDGLRFSIGILLVQWEDHFNASPSVLSWIGSACLFMVFSSTPVSSALAHRITYRWVTIGAGIVIVIALISLSLVQELWHMFTIVPLLGLGMGLAYQASCSFYITYFDKRFAFASGLNSSASGLGMFILPPLIETLIQFYGWRGALQIVAAIMANICVCGSLLRPCTDVTLKGWKLKIVMQP